MEILRRCAYLRMTTGEARFAVLYCDHTPKERHSESTKWVKNLELCQVTDTVLCVYCLKFYGDSSSLRLPQNDGRKKLHCLVPFQEFIGLIELRIQILDDYKVESVWKFFNIGSKQALFYAINLNCHSVSNYTMDTDLCIF